MHICTCKYVWMYECKYSYMYLYYARKPPRVEKKYKRGEERRKQEIMDGRASERATAGLRQKDVFSTEKEKENKYSAHHPLLRASLPRRANNE